MVFMLTLDYRTFTDKSHLIYIGLLRAAALRHVLRHGADGRAALDSARVFNLQPSEFAKVGVALVLAKFYGENRGTPSWTDLAIGGVLTAIPLGSSRKSRISARR
jgi:cell division protein FtsW (lipid II flippase)